MAEISEIVQIQITRETTSVSRAGFGTMLILGAHKVFNERTRTYTTSAAMLTDGFESTDPEYIAANVAFSQTPRPQQVKIGRRTVDSAGVSIDTVVATTDYTVSINGTAFTFNSGASPTAATIAAGLVGVINAGAEPVTATDDTDGTLTLAADVSGIAYTLSVVGTNLSVEKPYTATDAIADDITAVRNYDDDWYALVTTTRTQADVEAAAAAINSIRKIYVTASSDANILDSGSTTDVAYVLNNAAYDRTSVIYHTSPSTFPDAAWLGKQLPTDPGSTTWMFKTLTGIAATILTTTQSQNARAKEANTYETLGGVNITREGTMASGEYIDIIRGIDWLQARMEERIYSRLVNLAKIPFTDAGIAIIEAEIRAQLDDGIDNGLIAVDPEYTITVPAASSVSAAEKTARILPDIQFTATLAGAIHAVQVAGTVSV